MSSIVKGILLSCTVLLSGIAIGSWFLLNDPNEGEYKYSEVKLAEWANNGEVVLPQHIRLYLLGSNLTSPSYTFYDNISSFELLYDVKENSEWLLWTHSYDWRIDSSPVNRYSLLDISENTLIPISNALKETINSVLADTKMVNMSYKEFEVFRDNNLSFPLQSDGPYSIHTDFLGKDDVMVCVDFYPIGIVIRAMYFEQTLNWEIDYNYEGIIKDEGQGSPTGPTKNYYFLPVENFEECIQKSYITTWNSSLQKLIE